MGRKPMTEAEKKAWKEKMEAARAAKAAEKAKAAAQKPQDGADGGIENEPKNDPAAATDEYRAKEGEIKEEPESEVAALKQMVMQLQQQLAEQKPQIVQVMADVEKVVMRWQAEVADDNVAVFGANGMYGQVTGKRGNVIVPKSEWSRFYTESMRWMIDNRWLIVLSGMTEEERGLYNCSYTEGEILDEKAFVKLLEMGRELVAVFPRLCRAHQEMVARRFLDAWNAGDVRVSDRELVVALNELSKESYKEYPAADPRRKGLFWPLIDALNAKDAAR